MSKLVISIFCVFFLWVSCEFAHEIKANEKTIQQQQRTIDSLENELIINQILRK